MSCTPFTLLPIVRSVADELRAAGGAIHVADTHPGHPCRQCLRDAAVGEELVLVSYDPFGETDSPYRSASPIFLHRHDCGVPDTDGPLPSQLTSRLLSVRAFDADQAMIDATVIDGAELESTIQDLLADDTAQRLHVHNATRGCWAVTVARE